MDPEIQTFLIQISVPIGLIIFLSLFNHFVPKEYKERAYVRSFEKYDLPKIWKKAGFLGSVWAVRYHCVRDGSMMYSLKGFLFCPVCGWCPGYSPKDENSALWERSGLNSSESPNRGT